MARIERVRETLSEAITPEYVAEKVRDGWTAVSIIWERELEVEGYEPNVASLAQVPFGLQVASDCIHLTDDPRETETLMRMLAMIVDDLPLSRVAEELNRQGYRTRLGFKWSASSVFDMLPRLIEVGASMFRSEEWVTYRRHLMSASG